MLDDRLEIDDGSYASLIVRYDESEDDSSESSLDGINLDQDSELDVDSTACPSEISEVDSTGDEVSLTVLTGHGVIEQNFAEPFHEALQEMNLEIEDLFGQGHDGEDHNMTDDIHVLTHQWGELLGAFRNAVEAAGERPFLIVTFGLGLIDLGRRDTSCREREFDRILDHIRALWADHAQFAELQVVLVKPQPNLQIAQPHVVVIVEVLYVEVDHPDRGIPVLLHETGDTSVVRTWSAAHVGRTESATTILHSLQREQEIHPYGVRDAIVRCGGQVLPQFDFVAIEEGSLCTLWVSSYPLHVTAAASHVSNAESMFIDIRTIFENHQLDLIECVYHGISPQNKPLGGRSVWIPYHAFFEGSWYDQAKAVWPFPAINARLLYVKKLVEGQGVGDKHPVLHFVVSYGGAPNMIPVLTQQSVFAVDSGTSHSETWAVRLPEGLSSGQIVEHLHSPVFWTQYTERLRISTNGNPESINAGDAISLTMRTHRTSNILTFLAMDVTHSDVPESSGTSLLQIRAQRSHTSAFQEICAAILEIDVNEANEGDSRIRESTDLYVLGQETCCSPEPEDNSNLRRGCCEHEATDNEDNMPLNEVWLAQRIATLDCQVTQVEIVPKRPVTISLEAVIPVQDKRHVFAEDVSFQWFEKHNWEDYCKGQPSIQLVDLPEGLKVKKSTYHMLTACSNWQAVPSLTLLFIDGAAKIDKASWSFVVVDTDGWTQSLRGCAFGEVQLCPGHDEWCGADGVDNLAGELTALVMAQNWILKQADSSKFVILPDLMLSKNIAKLLSTCRAHPNLVKLARAQSNWINSKCDYMHVKGHAAFAWNELADSLASFAMHHGAKSFQCFPPDLHELACAKDDLNWVWMQDQTIAMAKCFPPLYQEQYAFFPPSFCKIGQQQSKETTPPEWSQLAFKAVTANVLAMDPKTEVDALGRQNASRTIRLDQQWHELAVQLVGIQEARTQAGRWQSERYHIISGGADFSHTAVLGCELWYHKSLAITIGNEDKPFALAEAPVVVQHADPRRLLVQFDLGVCKLEVVVLHVPVDKAQDDNKDSLNAWWAETKTILNGKRDAGLTLILVDANAPLASQETELVGLAGKETMNKAGEAFENFLHDQHFFAPTTMTWCHFGEHTTWTHPRGNKLRRDYILVNEGLFPFVQNSRVLHDHDNTFSHEDHRPVLLEVRGWIEVSRPRARIHWDYEKLRDPIRCRHFAEALATLPVPTWEVHIDSHCRIYEEQLLQLGRQYFERTRKQKVRPTLSENTLALIALKRSCLDYGRSTGEICQEDLKAELRGLENQVRKMVWKDTSAFFDTLLDQIDEANSLSDHRTVFKTLIRFGSRKSKQAQAGRPLPLLKGDDGEFAKNFHEQQQIWLKQFAGIEAGEQIHWDTLEQLNRSGLGVRNGDHELSLFPNEYQVEQVISKLKRQKATGPNEIPTDLLKAASAVVAKQLACLYAKAAGHAKEPLSWKGGYVAPLYKKGPVSLASSYRSIFISNYTAKIYHATLRQQLLSIWQSAIEHVQLGGRPSCGTDSAHHWIQIHSQWAAFHGLAQGMLFFDLRSAFYTVLRQSLTDVEDDGQAVMVAMIRLGMKPADVVSKLDKAKGESATQGLSRHGSLILKDALTNTHFQIRGSDTPVLTHRGTRPGDPLADVLFNLTMHMLLLDVKEIMQETTEAKWIGFAGAGFDVGNPQPIECPAYLDVSYVDDVVVAMHGFTNEDIRSMSMACVDAFRVAAWKRGLLLNFEPGKTELLWSIRGAGSKTVREKLALDGDVLCWSDAGESTELRVVKTYKHLGTWVQEKGKHGKEIKQRGSATAASWGPLVKPFYRKKQIALATKTRVLASLTVSRLLFNAHVWAGVNQDEFERWQNSARQPLYSIVKGLTHGIAPFRLTVEHLAGLAEMATPCDLVHAARLRYLKRFMANGHQMLWNLTWDSRSAKYSWLDLCRESLTWLKTFCPHKLPLADDSDFVDWLQFIMLDDMWKGRVKAALKSCKSYRHAYAVQHVWELHFENQMQAVGVPPIQVPIRQTASWECQLCGQTFRDKRALAMHSKHQHGYKTLVKYYAAGEICPCCVKWYHCRARLKTHLTTSHRCLETLIACFPPMQEDEVEAWDENDRERNRKLKQEGWWATKALHPVLRIHGPSLPPSDDPAAEVMRGKAQSRQQEPGSAFQMLQGRKVDEGLDETVDERRIDEDIPQVVMQSSGGSECGNGQFDEGGLAKVYARLHLRCMAFIHFFSGYRRANDLHHVLQEFSDGHGGILYVISVDMCMQKLDADLCAHSSSRFWFDRIKSGQVVGAGGGPPCETFSAARLQEGGPPPVRDLDHLFGLPALKPAQWRQVAVGSQLVRFIEEALLLLAMTGGCGFAEHPQWPAWAMRRRPCSIWVTKPMRLLKRLRCTTCVSFDQCVMEAEIRKPTTLVLIRLRSLRDDILKLGSCGRCNHGPNAHVALSGKDHDGSFKTSRGKIYPPMLNRAIGRAVTTTSVNTTA